MDGKLTQAEFAIAVYLVEQVRDGHQLPATLPPGPFPPTYLTQPQLLPTGLSLPQSPVAPPPPSRGSTGGSAARIALDFSASGASPLTVPSSPKMWSSGVPSTHPSSSSHPRPPHQPQHTPSAVSTPVPVPVSAATTPSFDPHSFDVSFDPLPPSARAAVTAVPIVAASSSATLGAENQPNTSSSLFTAGGASDENLFSADYGAATPPPPISRTPYESKLPDIDPGLVNQLAPEQQARIQEERGGAAAADEELRVRHTVTLDAKAKEQFYRWAHTPQGVRFSSREG